MKAMLVNIFTAPKLCSFLTLILFFGLSQSLFAASTWYADPTGVTVAIISGNGATSSGLSTFSSGPFTGTSQTVSASDVIVVQTGSKINVNASATVAGIVFTGGQLNLNVSGGVLSTGYCAGDVNGTTVGTGYFTYTTSLTFANRGRISLNSASATPSAPKVLWVNLTNSAPSIGATATSVDGYFSIFSNVKLGGNTTTNGRMLIGNSSAPTVYSLNLNGYTLSCDYYQGYTLNSGNRVSNTYGSLAAVTGGGSSPSINLTNASGTNNASTLYMDQTSIGTTDNVAITMNNAGGLTLYSNATLSGLTLTSGNIYLNGNTVNAATFPSGSYTSYLASGSSSSAAGGGYAKITSPSTIGTPTVVPIGTYNTYLPISFANTSTSPSTPSFTVGVSPITSSYLYLSSASSSSTTVTCASTANLTVGSTVTVIGGTGAFAANTTVATITSATQFTVSSTPTTALLAGASILATSTVASVANLSLSSASGSGTTITCTSTSNLTVGATVTVTGGTGAFATNTTVSTIISATQFTVSQAPSTGLSGATILATSIPNVANSSNCVPFVWSVKSTLSGATSSIVFQSASNSQGLTGSPSQLGFATSGTSSISGIQSVSGTTTSNPYTATLNGYTLPANTTANTFYIGNAIGDLSAGAVTYYTNNGTVLMNGNVITSGTLYTAPNGGGTTNTTSTNTIDNIIVENGGTLTLGTSAATFGYVTVNSGGTLNVNIGLTTATNLTVAGTATSNSSGIIAGGVVVSNGGTLTTSAAISSGGINVNNGGTANIGASITGGSSIAGTLYVTAASVSLGTINLTGTLNINAGTSSTAVTTSSDLTIGSSATLNIGPSSTGYFSITGNLLMTGGNLSVATNSIISLTKNLAGSADGTTTQATGTLSGAGSIYFNGGALGTGGSVNITTGVATIGTSPNPQLLYADFHASSGFTGPVTMLTYVKLGGNTILPCRLKNGSPTITSVLALNGFSLTCTQYYLGNTSSPYNVLTGGGNSVLILNGASTASAIFMDQNTTNNASATNALNLTMNTTGTSTLNLYNNLFLANAGSNPSNLTNGIVYLNGQTVTAATFPTANSTSFFAEGISGNATTGGSLVVTTPSTNGIATIVPIGTYNSGAVYTPVSFTNTTGSPTSFTVSVSKLTSSNLSGGTTNTIPYQWNITTTGGTSPTATIAFQTPTVNTGFTTSGGTTAQLGVLVNGTTGYANVVTTSTASPAYLTSMTISGSGPYIATTPSNYALYNNSLANTYVIANTGSVFPLPTITSAVTASTNAANVYSYTITGANIGTLNASNLPSGISFSSPTISGTPSVTASGVTNINLTNTNIAGLITKTLALTISVTTWYADPTATNIAVINNGTGSTASSSGWSSSPSGGDYTATGQTISASDVIVVQTGSKINVNGTSQVGGIVFSGGQLNMNAANVVLGAGNCAGDVGWTTVGTGYYTYTTSLTYANRGNIILNSASATITSPKVLGVNFTNSAPTIGGVATSVDGYISVASNLKLIGNTTTYGRMQINGGVSATVYSLNLNGYTLSCDYYQGYTTFSGSRVSNTFGSLAAVGGGGSAPEIILTNTSGNNSASTLYMDQTSVGTTDKIAITMNNVGGLTLNSNITSGSLTLTSGVIYLNGNTVTANTFPTGNATSYLAGGTSGSAGTGYATITAPSTNGTPTIVPIGTYNTFLPVSFANTTLSPSYTIGISALNTANVQTSANCIPFQWTISSSVASSQSDITFYSNSATGITSSSKLGVLTTLQLSGGYTSMTTNLATASAYSASSSYYIKFSGYALPDNTSANTFVIGTNGSVFPLPTITSANSGNASENQPYTYTIIGANAGTFNATNLPAGLSFSSPTISGSPSSVGLTNITLTNTNIAGVATQNLALTVTSGPVISSALVAVAQLGSPFSYTIIASNSPTSYGAFLIRNGIPIVITGSSTPYNISGATISGIPSTFGIDTLQLVVTNASGDCPSTYLYLNVLAVPTITSLTPNTATVDAASFTMTVNGTNFANTYSQVTWGGTTLSTTYVNASQLIATVPASYIAHTASSNTASVGVISIGSNTVASPATTPSSVSISSVINQPFTITVSTPTITGIYPSSNIAGSGSFIVIVVGTNFVLGVSTITWNGTPLTTTFTSATSLKATVPDGNITSAGTVSVGVSNIGAGVTNSTGTTKTFTTYSQGVTWSFATDGAAFTSSGVNLSPTTLVGTPTNTKIVGFNYDSINNGRNPAALAICPSSSSTSITWNADGGPSGAPVTPTLNGTFSGVMINNVNTPRYVQFDVKPQSGYNFSVTNMAIPLTNNTNTAFMFYAVAYSLDGFSSFTYLTTNTTTGELFSAAGASALITSSHAMVIPDGTTLSIRVIVYDNKNSSATITGTININNVLVAGTSLVSYASPVLLSSAADVNGYQSTLFTGTYTYAATETAGHPNSYSATGLPAGLSINSTSGVVSGTPTVHGTYPVVFKADNGNLFPISTTINFVISIAPLSAPTADSVQNDNVKAFVFFTAPSLLAGQDAVSSYKVYAYANGSGIVSTSTTALVSALTLPYNILVSGLSNGTSYTFKVSAINDQGEGVLSSSTVAVVPSSNTTWNGTSWSAGEPDISQNVIIAANLTTATSLTCNNLTVNSGVTFVNNGTLTIKGATIVNNGRIIGSGTVLLNGNSAQTVSGNGVVANLTVNNSHNSSISSGSNNLGVTGVLTLTSGVLTTNGNLTLKSTSITNSGILAPYGINGNTGTISGNVTVERYIPKGFRAYRDISAGGVYSASNYLFNTWQEGGSYTNNGYGMFITGIKDVSVNHNVLDASSGLDHSLTGYASAFYYRAGWDTVKNTKTELLNPYQSYRVLIRGDRSFDLDTTPVIAIAGPTVLAMYNATTLRASGTLITGNVTYSRGGVSNPVFSNSIGLNNASNSYTYVANPYACPIDFKNIYDSNRLTNMKPSYYYLDPTIGSTGAWVVYNAASDASSKWGINDVSGRYIQVGQGFLVRDTTLGTPSLTITEADKVTGLANKTAIFGNTAPNSKLGISLMKQSGTGYFKMDGAIAVFGSQFSNGMGVEDAAKMSNATDNLAFIEGSHSLSIDGRIPATTSDVLGISLGQLNSTGYQLVIDASAYTANGVAPYLQDAFTNKAAILLNGIDTISFTADAKVAATYQNRFSIIFKPTILSVNSIVAIASANGNVTTITWNTVGEKSVATFEIEKSTDGTCFNTIGQQTAKNTATASYTSTENNVTKTTYYRIKAVSTDGAIGYSNIAKVTYNLQLTTYNLFPNPLTGKNLNVQLGNVVAGKYVVSITNALGQKVAESTINHAGGSGTHAISINSTIAAGVYNVSVSSVDSRQSVYQTNLSVQ